MSRISTISFPSLAAGAALLAFLGGAAIAAQDRYALKVPDGLAFSEFRGYENWHVVGVSQSANIIDVIVGNPAAIAAYRAGIPGNGKPFPDGAKLAKIHWNTKKLSDAFTALVPDTLHDVDFMARDSKRFAGPDHWGYAQFNYDATSDGFTPLGTGPNCGTACHQAASARDFVFTPFPKR